MIWRHVMSSGPFPWQPGQDWSLTETPDGYVYVYRECKCQEGAKG